MACLSFTRSLTRNGWRPCWQLVGRRQAPPQEAADRLLPKSHAPPSCAAVAHTSSRRRAAGPRVAAPCAAAAGCAASPRQAPSCRAGVEEQRLGRVRAEAAEKIRPNSTPAAKPLSTCRLSTCCLRAQHTLPAPRLPCATAAPPPPPPPRHACSTHTPRGELGAVGGQVAVAAAVRRAPARVLPPAVRHLLQRQAKHLEVAAARDCGREGGGGRWPRGAGFRARPLCPPVQELLTCCLGLHPSPPACTPTPSLWKRRKPLKWGICSELKASS